MTRLSTRIALQLAVSAAFVGLLLWRVNLGRLWSQISGASWQWLLLAVPCFVASAVFGGVRWWLLVRGVARVPLRAGIVTLLATGALDLLLPLRAGTVALFQILSRRYGVRRAAVIGSAGAGGLVDIVATVALVLALSPLLALGSDRALGLTLGVAAALAVLAMVLLFAFRGRSRSRLLEPLPERARRRVQAQLDYLLSGFSALGSIGTVVPLLLFTFADWGAAALGYAAVGRGFGLHVAWPAYLLVECTGNLAGLVPLTEGNIGTYEIAVQGLLRTAGVDGAKASAFAVGAHATLLLTTLVVAVCCMAVVRVKPADLFHVESDPTGR